MVTMTAKGCQRELIRVRSIAACLLVVMLATGCTKTISGTTRPASNLKPRPLTGQTVGQVLLDEAALSRILDQRFETKPDWPPVFGGAEALQSAGPVSLPDCVGVMTITEQRPYQSAKVKSVARQY
jgi:PknH-like extracellular domain